MNFLRRELAPISTDGWNEIDSLARETLAASLSGRKFIDVDGPHGINHACVNIGRLAMPGSSQPGTVGYGIHQVQPLIEARVDFSLETWELDNIERGARDIQLDALVDACREIALFEEQAIFNGFADASIQGIHASLDEQRLPIQLDMDSLVDAVSEGQTQMLRAGVEGPANLVVSASLWKYLARSSPGGTLRSLIERQIEGQVIYSELVKDALLVSARGGDLELCVGQDFAVGYHSHSAREIKLFITESFTFRVIAPEAMVGYTL